MKKRNLIAIGILTTILLTGCQTSSNNAETEALQQQISALEQQVAALEQQVPTDAEDGNVQNTTEEDTSSETAASIEQAESTKPTEPSAEGDNTQTPSEPSQDTASSGQKELNTTYTLEELTTMVNDYVEKVKATSPSGTSSENMETFFSLKQEENQIDDTLDLHEDELKYLYRQNVLTREEYAQQDRELERLEDQLDNAEDWLEYTFGIDD